MEELKDIIANKQKEFLDIRKTQLINLCEQNLKFANEQDKALSFFIQNDNILLKRTSLKHYISNLDSIVSKIKNVKDDDEFRDVLRLYKQSEGMLTLDKMDIY